MSAPETEMFDAVPVVRQDEPAKPPREMSQAAITSFFYGTLQLLFTSVSSALLFVLMQGIRAFESALSGTGAGSAGTDSIDVAEVQKMVEELGIVDPTLSPVTTAPPSPAPMPLPVQGESGFSFDTSPSQIMPMEVAIILLTHGFGILGLLTAIIAFRAVSKGKSGRGLAVTGLISSFLSFVIAFMVALAT